MERLWAPWRMEYIKNPNLEKCIFCIGDDESQDEGRLILFRGKKAFIMMNRYPYANGHLMVAPYRHIGEFKQLKDSEAVELFKLMKYSIRVLEKVLKPQGINIGMNLGRAAGAGVVDHLHIHIVPRWVGDVNFMPVLSETKVICEHLRVTYKNLKQGFSSLGL